MKSNQESQSTEGNLLTYCPISFHTYFKVFFVYLMKKESHLAVLQCTDDSKSASIRGKVSAYITHWN